MNLVKFINIYYIEQSLNQNILIIQLPFPKFYKFIYEFLKIVMR